MRHSAFSSASTEASPSPKRRSMKPPALPCCTHAGAAGAFSRHIGRTGQYSAVCCGSTRLTVLLQQRALAFLGCLAAGVREVGAAALHSARAQHVSAAHMCVGFTTGGSRGLEHSRSCGAWRACDALAANNVEVASVTHALERRVLRVLRCAGRRAASAGAVLRLLRHGRGCFAAKDCRRARLGRAGSGVEGGKGGKNGAEGGEEPPRRARARCATSQLSTSSSSVASSSTARPATSTNPDSSRQKWTTAERPTPSLRITAADGSGGASARQRQRRLRRG
jgi:hypothetical protein